jgi:ATP-binding cassette, subfamily B, bacterial
VESTTDTARIARLFKPYRARLSSVLALIGLSAGLSMVSPFLLRAVLDDAIPERDTTLLTWLVAGMIAISVATGALGVAQTWLSNMVGQRVMHDLRAAVYRHLQRLSLASSRARAPVRSSRASPTTSAACRTSSPPRRRRSSPT